MYTILPPARCIVHISHSTLYTEYYTKHTVNYIVHTGNCTLHATRYNCVLHTTHCTLHTAYYTLYTAHCTLHTSQCTLHTVHYTLHTAYCTMNNTYWKHTTYYTLQSPEPKVRPTYITFYSLCSTMMATAMEFVMDSKTWFTEEDKFFFSLHCYINKSWHKQYFRKKCSRALVTGSLPRI